jgi:23S rRNA (guanosine2251-2'-O)-methyltransferase
MAETLYGHHPILEALRARRRRVQRIEIADGTKEVGDVARILAEARKAKVQVGRSRRHRLDSLSHNANHKGVVAQVSPYPYVDWDDLLSMDSPSGSPPLLLLLDRLQDPQNVGTLMRTSDAVGISGIVIPKHRAAEITPAVSSASAGAVEHLRVAIVTNMSKAIGQLKDQGFWVMGLERAPGAVDPAQARLDGKLALVVGSEGFGLSRLVRESCDLLIELPMAGEISSLNAAVAGSIALYMVWRARNR